MLFGLLASYIFVNRLPPIAMIATISNRANINQSPLYESQSTSYFFVEESSSINSIVLSDKRLTSLSASLEYLLILFSTFLAFWTYLSLSSTFSTRSLGLGSLDMGLI